MKKTNKLLAGILASMVCPGSAVYGWSLQGNGAEVKGQNPQPDERWKTDPGVQQNADAIFDKSVEGTTSTTSKTLAELAKEFPNLTRVQVEQALKRLVYDGRAIQQGDGSKDNPYRYYERTRHGG